MQKKSLELKRSFTSPDNMLISKQSGSISLPGVSVFQNKQMPGDMPENHSSANSMLPVQRKANRTGLPDNLKSGVEHLSGLRMDDVKVHYNSSKPAQLNAYAYAQGNQIHVGPGHETHLAHEAWHVVQQKNGRVKETNQLKSGVSVNDDDNLEAEADYMGAKALTHSNYTLSKDKTNSIAKNPVHFKPGHSHSLSGKTLASLVIQRDKKVHKEGDLHYGFAGNRLDGMREMVHQAGDEALTVDTLNKKSGITATFRNNYDYMAGYFNVIDLIKKYESPGLNESKSDEWLSFLKLPKNLAYLGIQKHIGNVGDDGNHLENKNRLTKNGTPVKYVNPLQRKNAILTSYRNKSSKNIADQDEFEGQFPKEEDKVLYNSRFKEEVNSWLWDVFFRRTSKLGIKFTVKRGKVIHMNNTAPVWKGNQLSGNLVSVDAAKANLSRQPITHSELRYINRKYGVSNSQIDIYQTIPEKPTKREENMGSIVPEFKTDLIKNCFALSNLIREKCELNEWGTTVKFFSKKPAGVNSILKIIKNNNNLFILLRLIGECVRERMKNNNTRHIKTTEFYNILQTLPVDFDAVDKAPPLHDKLKIFKTANIQCSTNIRNLTEQLKRFSF